MHTKTRPAQRRNIHAPAVALTLLGIATVLPPGVLAQGRTDTVVLTGQAAPGVGGGTFSGFGGLVLNTGGQTVFLASITGSSSTQGIFRSDSGSTLTTIARLGQGAPGAGGGTFNSFLEAVLNASGQVAFSSFVSGGTNNAGVFRSDGGSALTAIARVGQNATGTGGGTFSSFGSPVLNNSGQMAFFSSVTGGSSTLGIFRSNSGGTLTAVARQGQSAPGEGGGTFSNLFSPVLNASGQTAFLSRITGGTNTQGIFRSDSGSTLTAIAREGQNAPGAGGGTFSDLGSPVLNASGQTAFLSSIAGGTNTEGIFRSDSGSTLTAIAREGQSAPGAGGGTFRNLFPPLLNASGQTSFVSSITGGANTEGIFRSDSGSTLTAIARPGQSAPGAGGGTFNSFSVFHLLNASGQIAFSASITGGTSSGGLFMADGRDTVTIQLQGASLAGKTVSFLNSLSSDGLNDFGQVAYQASFTDGTRGVFLYTPALRWRETFSSSWDTASRWTLGIAPGSVHDVSIDPSATLTVTGPAGAVTVRSLVVGSGTGFATLTLNGGSIDAASPVQIASRGILAGNGTISAQVVNVGEVRADNLILAGGLVNNGTVRSLAAGNQRIDANLSNEAAGLVRVGSGEVLKLNGIEHSNSGLVEARGGGELQVSGSFTNAANGRVVLDNGSARFNDGLVNDGQVQVSFGGASVFGDINTRRDGKIILSGNSNTTFYDDIDMKSGGELRVSSGSTAVFFGPVQQRSGSLFTGTGTKFYEGGLYVGGSPGLGIDSGNVNFGAGNVFVVDIGGTTACTSECETNEALRNTSFDKYVVNGHLALGGTLKLGSWGGFEPQAGQSFDLLDWGSASGSFDHIDASGLGLAAGLTLDTSRLALDGSISVTAVPEPGSWALMALGLAGLAGWKRRNDAASRLD